jgi:hypothetical protein
VRSARGMSGEIQGHDTHRLARNKSSKVLAWLVVVFAVGYMPYFLITYFATLGITAKNSVSEYIVALVFFLFFLNSAVNPVAIYVSSARYRKYFNRFFCMFLCKTMLRKNRSPSC